jgi:hypothetical protein
MLQIDGKVDRDDLVIKGVCVDTVLSIAEVMNGRTWEEIPSQRERLFAGSDNTVVDGESSAAMEELWRAALADPWSIGRRLSQHADAAHSLPRSMRSERLWLAGPESLYSHLYRAGREPAGLPGRETLRLSEKLPPRITSRPYGSSIVLHQNMAALALCQVLRKSVTLS